MVFHITDKNIVMMIDGSAGITWMEKAKPVVADFYRERLEIEGLFCLPFYKKTSDRLLTSYQFKE